MGSFNYPVSEHDASIVVTLSNLEALIPLWYCYENGFVGTFVQIFFMMIASISHHATAVNRNITPLIKTRYAGFLLWIDRLMATSCIIHGIYILSYYEIEPEAIDIFFVLLALISLFVSDLLTRRVTNVLELLVYTIFHTIWHVLAFYLFYRLLYYSK